MQFGVYIYKQYDTDILSLADAGYDVNRMMKEAVCGYANNRPVNFYIDRLVSFDVNGRKSIRVMLNVPKSDKKTIYMLQHIKDRYRGRFCKAVFRNALVQQNICCYFADENLMQLQNDNMRFVNLSMYQNLKPVSSYIKQQKLTVLDKTIVMDAKTEKTDFYGGAFVNLSKDDYKEQKPVRVKEKKADQPDSMTAAAIPTPQPNPVQQAVPDLSVMMKDPQFMAQMMQMFGAMQQANNAAPVVAATGSENPDVAPTEQPEEDDEITLADNDALLDAFSNI